jgi:hypothetical protein
MSHPNLLIVLSRSGFAGFAGLFLAEQNTEIQNSLPLRTTLQTPQTPYRPRPHSGGFTESRGQGRRSSMPLLCRTPASVGFLLGACFGMSAK